MDRLVGLAAFSVGLGSFVFSGAAARAAADRLGRPSGHRTTVAVRSIGLAGMAFGFAMVLR